MTATASTPYPCPSCRSDDIITNSDGTLFCLACRNEWNPQAIALADPPTIPPPALATVDDILTAPPDVMSPAATQADDDFAAELVDLTNEADAESERFLADLIGTRVVLDGGQWATLIGFPDNDHADVRLDDGDTATVDFNDILRAVPNAPEPEPDDVDVDDEIITLIGDSVITVACLTLEAGLASLTGTGADAQLVMPPIGWAPEDVDIIPVLEQGAAVAVAMLCKAFDLPRDIIAASIQSMRPTTREGAQTEVTQ